MKKKLKAGTKVGEGSYVLCSIKTKLQADSDTITIKLENGTSQSVPLHADTSAEDGKLYVVYDGEYQGCWEVIFDDELQ